MVTKVDNIDTSDFVLKAKYKTDKTELENKISDTSGLVKKTDYNAKITKIEGKIPDISDLAIKTVLTAVENKIPDVSILVKKQTITQKLLLLKINLTLICMNWVPGYPRNIFLVTSFTRKMPESSDSMYSSIFMLENI